MQIRPLESFPVLYQISDPSDANTYYVRAVVRNSATGATIKIAGNNFVNLIVSQSNSRRFSANIQAPSDASGNGFWIDVTTSVYTDSSYTTKSAIYSENLDKYLIQERWTIAFGGGGGWGDWDTRIKKVVDYDKIDDLVSKHVKSIPRPKFDDFDPKVIVSHSKDIKKMLTLIGERKSDPIDLDAHARDILAGTERQIKGIQFPPVDIESIIDRINSINIPEHPDYTPHFENLKKTFIDGISDMKVSMPTSDHIRLMDHILSIPAFALAVSKKKPDAPEEDPRLKELSS